MKNNQSGRSMVEMLGVLAIIGVLSAGGLAGYSKAMFKHKLNNTMDQITMLVTNIRTMYGTQGSYAGLSNYEAYRLGIVPAVMVASDVKEIKNNENEVTGHSLDLSNPFKGDVVIDTVAINGAETGFTVTYKDLPKEACIALATADFGSGAGSGFIGTTIGSAQSGHYGQADEGNAFAMADSGEGGATKGAISLCTTDSMEITWTFY